MPDNILTPEELNLLADRSIFDLRARIYPKIQELLVALREELEQVTPPGEPPFADPSWILSGKISKGENYKGLPFRVLDYPACFEQHHLFIFRTLMLWGCHFSFHLILTGKQMEKHRDALAQGYPQLQEMGFRLSKQDSPWDWTLDESSHYSTHELDQEGFANVIRACTFIKISREWPIEQFAEVPRVGCESWAGLARVLGLISTQ